MAAALNENIDKTLGLPYEFIAFDNRERHWSICKVYNDCAQKAQYDYLCFLHEDVRFNTENWGNELVEKLCERDCGVIGFAGSVVKLNMPSGWGCTLEACRAHLVQHHNNGEVTHDTVNPNNERFARVITLDGLCLFMPKRVWSEIRFDEERFDAFHGYDLDIAMSVAERYKNYVCFTLEIEHLSEGSYNEQWIKATKDIHKKWEAKLPISTPEWDEYVRNHENTISLEYQFLRHTIKNTPQIINARRAAFVFFSNNWNKSHYGWLILVKLIDDKFKKKRGR